MKYLIVVFCCWFSVVIYGQNSLEWVESYDFDRQRIKDCLVLQNKAQDLVLFAETSKKELYFATLDNSGTIRSKQKFPWKNAKLNAVLAAEGFYVLVGYEKEGSKKYPALWSINNITNRLQKHDLELPLETGILQDIDQNANEEIIVTGQLGDSLYLLRMDKNLGKVRDTKINSEKGISGGQALTINSYGQVFVTGFQNKNGRDSLQVWKFNDDFGLIASLDTLRPGTGEDILITEDNEVLVLGNYDVTPFKKNAQFLFLRSNLKRSIQPKKPEHPLLESEYNQSGNSMILLPHQSVLIVGETTKFGASMRDILISTIYNINDTIVIRESIELRRDDWATKVIRLKNKNYVISAISEQRVKLFYYKSSDNPCEQQLPPDRAVAFVPLSNRKTVIGTNNSSLEGMLLAKQPIAKSNVAVRNSFLGRKSWLSEDDDWDVFKFIPQPTLNGQYCYYLEKSLLLKYGPNLVDLNINTDQNPFNYSEELYCVPEKPNLHLLSIGINYENLEFTDEDANDFAALFESQEQQGALYESIETTVLTTKDETRASEIESKIAELGKKDLKNKDVIILFISAHGIDEQGRFVIPDPFYKAGFRKLQIGLPKANFG